MTIENVSDTARWVAVYRAMESERPDALFRDPYARGRRLAGAKGDEIVRMRSRTVCSMARAMIVRTAGVRRDHRRPRSQRMAFHLGAQPRGRGSNVAPPCRLELPPTLRWVDVDLPEILRYKLETLGDEKPKCRYEAAETDLTDAGSRRALFARIGAEARRVLVVTEGLLIDLERCGCRSARDGPARGVVVRALGDRPRDEAAAQDDDAHLGQAGPRRPAAPSVSAPPRARASSFLTAGARRSTAGSGTRRSASTAP